MSFIQTIIAWFTALFDQDHDNDFDESDVEQIIEAAYQRGGVGFVNTATLGAPTIEKPGGDFTDAKVVVPLTVADHDNPSPLVFDLPEGPQDIESDLFSLMQRFGVDKIDDLENIVGEDIPVSFEENAFVPRWKAMDEKTVVFENTHTAGVGDEDSSPPSSPQ